MKILLYGNWKSNSGPSNVNRSLIQHSDKDLIHIKHPENKILRITELLFKSLFCDVVVFSHGGNSLLCKYVKLLGKKVAILKHGDVEYENEINHLGLDKGTIDDEMRKMELADSIICVSEKYAGWNKKRYPQFSAKINWVNNGITLSPRPSLKKKKNAIAIGGGNRNIKNNLNICKAVEMLNGKGAGLEVKLFGRLYKDNSPLEKFNFVHIMGHMDKESYLSELDSVNLYIDLAFCEPFGLSIADALNCHCSVLLSKEIGFTSILKVQDSDLVSNCSDIQEIANKIEFNLNNNNSERLLSSINKETSSEASSYKRLKAICNNLLN